MLDENIIKGRIIKGVGGFYYISADESIYECRARGRFRKEGITPLVGDLVECKIDDASNTGMITEIYPRTSCLIRPAVSNVTQIAIVLAVINPKPNLRVVDKLISSAVYAGIKPIICVNKSDLSKTDELCDIYSRSGFEVLSLSAKDNLNIEKLIKYLEGEITVFGGISGVGKSSILNRVLKDDRLMTGEVSHKVERGKHTTRHSELMPIETGNGYIIDTPGFSSFAVSDIDESELEKLFPDFAPYIGDCEFLDCRHTVGQKGCAVLKAIEEGKLSRTRHESYMEQYKEILDNKKY